MRAWQFWLASIFLFLVSLQDPAHAAASDSSKLYLGAGAYIPYVGRLTNTSKSDGSTSFTSGTMAALSVTGQFKFYKNIGLSPLLAYTLFGHKSNDGGEKSYYLPIALRLNRRFKMLDLRAGPGVLFYSVKGSGGTATLSNGGSTSVFALPSSTASAHFYFIDLGMGVVARRLRVDLDGLVSGALSKRRAVSLLATASFGFF